jgi:non-specific serine/threonine protein kinase
MLFRRLVVFAGGCTIEAAEAVCAEDGQEGEVLEHLIALVDHHLLKQEEQADGTARFSMLETVREYGLEQLEGQDEAVALRRRHALHYLALAEEAEPELARAGQVTWARRLAGEHDNMRSALEWALKAGEEDVAWRLGGSLWWFWFVRGYAIEGGQWLRRIVDADRRDTPAIAPALRAKVYYGAMELAFQRADYAYGGTMVAQALPLCEACGDRRGMVLCFLGFGFAALAREDTAEAARQFQASLDLAQQAQDAWAATVALFSLGWLPLLGGDLDRATAMHEECLAQRRVVGDTWGVAASLHTLGLVAQTRGDIDKAAALFKEGLAQYFLLANEQGLVDCVEGLAAAASARGRAVTAAQLFGATAAWREALGASLWPIARMVYERATRETRDALGDDAHARAWAAGKGMDLSEATEVALRQQDWV